MTVTSSLEVDTKVSHPTWHIRFLESNDRIFAVASRYQQYVDILEITNGLLAAYFPTRTAVDVTDGKPSKIFTILENPYSQDCILLAGEFFMKSLRLEAKKLEVPSC